MHACYFNILCHLGTPESYSHVHSESFFLTQIFFSIEQIGQEMLENLSHDREKIQRARERVSISDIVFSHIQ